MQRRYLITTLIIMTFIFVQSALPGDLSSNESNFIVQLLVALFDVDAGSVGFAVRKCAHFTEYLVLGLSLGFTVDDFVGMPETGGGKAKSLSLAWGIGALYACTDEFHQRFVPGRSGELRDVGIDCCGVLTGVLLYTAYRRLKNRQQAMSERK